MTTALYRVDVGGQTRLARGPAAQRPTELLDPALTLATVLAGAGGMTAALAGLSHGPVPPDARVLAPLDAQEVWAAGVTYRRSLDGRVEESREPTVYDRVYDAPRPELFFKAAGWRVRGPGQTIGVRRDSDWDVPEPELALVVAADGTIVGYTAGNDVSSRSIEGENPLYLPQAKVYEAACALGPCIVAAGDVELPLEISLAVERAGATVLKDATSTDRLHRELPDLVGHLFAALSFPAGVVLLTGTGIVPPSGFTLEPDDVVTVAVDRIGALVNRVVPVGTPT